MGKLVSVVMGFLFGVIVTMVIVSRMASGLMLIEDTSTKGFAETVEAIKAAAEAADWKVPAVHPISESTVKAGYEVRPVTVIELCKPSIAGPLLADEDSRLAASMMPCRVAVYENADGSVTVGRMNSVLMSKLFGGLIEQQMTLAATENEEIFASVLAR
jgi:uncharacterized protein (DUF302 family)